MPITGLAVQVHHRDDPDPIRFFEVNDRVRKTLREIPPRRRVELVELARMGTDRRDGALDLIVETDAQLGLDLGVEPRRLGVLGIGFRMEEVRLHRPTIWRIFSEVTAPGMPCTCPLRISAMRRWTVPDHALAAAGSWPPCMVRRIRSTNSATTSCGIDRVCSTIWSTVMGMAPTVPVPPVRASLWTRAVSSGSAVAGGGDPGGSEVLAQRRRDAEDGDRKWNHSAVRQNTLMDTDPERLGGDASPYLGHRASWGPSSTSHPSPLTSHLPRPAASLSPLAFLLWPLAFCLSPQSLPCLHRNRRYAARP